MAINNEGCHMVALKFIPAEPSSGTTGALYLKNNKEYWAPGMHGCGGCISVLATPSTDRQPAMATFLLDRTYLQLQVSNTL